MGIENGFVGYRYITKSGMTVPDPVGLEAKIFHDCYELKYAP